MNFELEWVVTIEKTVFLQRNKNNVFYFKVFPFHLQNIIIGKSTKNNCNSTAKEIYIPSFTWTDIAFARFCHCTFATFCANKDRSLRYKNAER